MPVPKQANLTAGMIRFSAIGILLAAPGFSQLQPCTIETVAGGGSAPQDATGPASEASLGWPAGIAVSDDGTAYFADRSNWRIRKIRPDGIIETIAGTGESGRPENGAIAVQSPVTEPIDVALGPSGDLYVATRVTSQVIRIDANGLVWLVAGTGNQTCYLYHCGEGLLATEAETPLVTAVRVDQQGVVYLVHDLSAAGISHGWLRRIDLSGKIHTVIPEGGVFTYMQALDLDPEGRPLWAEGRVHEVSYFRLEHNVPVPFKPTKVYLRSAKAIAAAPDGGFYVAADPAWSILRVTPKGRVFRVAGQQTPGFAGDGGPASEAMFLGIKGLEVSPAGDLWISDQGNARVRRIAQVEDCPLSPAPMLEGIIPFRATTPGVYQNGNWLLDVDSDGVFDAGVDRSFSFALAGAQPLKGDWNGDGVDEAGLYLDGFWFLDYDGDGTWDGGVTDKQFHFGWAGVQPVVGDWNGNGRETIGIFVDGHWFLDADGDGIWSGPGVDIQASFGWNGVTPIVGDWNGDGRAKIGVFLNGFWFLDSDGSGAWDGPSVDLASEFGWTGVTPVTGDWNGDGRETIGIYFNGFWFLDSNGNGAWDGADIDIQANFGFAGALPVTGDWDGDGREKVGIFVDGFWYLDFDGSAGWDGGVADRVVQWGSAKAQPIVGRW